MRRRRDHDVAQDDRVVIGAEHLGNREAVDVGVEQADLLAGLGQRDGEVHRHRRLADTTLRRGDADDSGLASRGQERRHGRRGACPWPRTVVVAVWPWPSSPPGSAASPTDAGPQPLAERRALLLVHHDEVELHSSTPATPRRPGGSARPALPCPARRPPGGRPRSAPAAGAAHRSHQAEVTERQADLGIQTASTAASSCDWSTAMHSLVSGGVRIGQPDASEAWPASPQLKGLIPR